jgi:hypothetical protein
MDKQNIIRDFPNIKLSYENITHKKVYNSDMILLIPEGKKCFAWFTYVNDKPSCLIMELTTNKNIVDIKQMNACFSNELSYGTIFYGTLFYHLHSQFFCIEDIFSSKGEFIERENWGSKMIKINKLLKNDLKQMSYNNSFVIFGLPITCRKNDEIEYTIKNTTYKIDSIQYRLFDRINNYLFMKFNNYIDLYKSLEIRRETPIPKEIHLLESTLILEERQRERPRHEKIVRQQVKREVVFLIKPDIQNDIYYLYCLDELSRQQQHSIAHIPDYNTSVMMNKLFRIIKENKNLDALEESDDEEEFENEEITKFVHLDKSYKMFCQFNHKFKKWTPIKLANENSEITKKEELKQIYHAYDQNKRK